MLLARSLVLTGAVTLATLASASPASAEPIAGHEMPFPCGQSWTGSTRDSHSPSRYALDFNRPDDLSDPVVATAPGTVTTADRTDNSGYGRWVYIDHGNSEKSLYAHLSAVQVSAGQKVDQGQQIGTVGSTGNSSGPHLHFEQRTGSKVTWPYFSGTRFTFGSTRESRNCVEVPLAANWYDGAAAELTTFRRSRPSLLRIRKADGAVVNKSLGRPTDEPVVGDWDGDGRANAGFFRPAGKVFRLRSTEGPKSIRFGAVTDKPVSGDWDGDGRWDVGTWSAARNEFALRAGNGTVSRVRLGDRNDLPVTGDWDGDGRFEVGVYDQATARYTLRKVDEEGTVWLATVTFGRAGDLPVTGDWDGNGRTDLGAWRPASAVFSLRRAPSPTTATRSIDTVRFGKRR